MRQIERGKLINHGGIFEPHELATAEFLVERGKTVELLIPANSFKRTNADLLMQGVIWEMKSPVVNTSQSLTRLFYRGTTQSENLIFDLRRLKACNQPAQTLLRKLFQSSRKVRKLLIITQAEALLIFEKA